MKALENTPHKYQEICSHILVQIESGELPPGSRLPGVRALGERFGCNYHTVRHAFEALAEQGYLELKRGSGTYVTERAGDFGRRMAFAKTLRTTDVIGILLPLRRWGHYVNSLIGQLHKSAELRGLRLMVRTTPDIGPESIRLSHEFFDGGCCSVILPWIGEKQHLGRLHDFVRASKLPVVVPNPVLGLEKNCYRDPSIDENTRFSSTYLQCCYFKELGFRNIALLGPSSETAEFFERKILQYSRWCDKNEFPNLVGLVYGEPGNYDRLICRWAPMKGDIAVIAYHDEMALAFMKACAEKGYSVPDDFAVLGHNNNPNGLRSTPALSTMPCSYAGIADGMIDHALNLSKGTSKRTPKHEKRTLCIRESCGGRMRMGDGLDGLLKTILNEFN